MAYFFTLCLSHITHLLARKMICALVISCLGSLPSIATSASAPFGSMTFEKLLLSDEENQSIGPTMSIVQDETGFMWFGGENGLARFDGHSYRYYFADSDKPGSLSSNYIWKLFVDHEGVLWVATVNGLNRYNQNSDTFYTYWPDSNDRYSIAGVDVFDINEDEQGRLYLATNNGLSVLDKARTAFTNYVDRPDRNPLKARAIRDIFIDANHIWLSSLSNGLIRLDRDFTQIKRWTHIEGDDSSIPSDDVHEVMRDEHGQLWIATYGSGVARLNADGKTFTNYGHNPADPYSIGGDAVWEIFKAQDGGLWFAVDHGGLAYYDESTDSFFRYLHNPTDDSSISSNQVRSIYQSANGDFWVGAFPAGVNYSNANKRIFTSLTHDPAKANTINHNGILSMSQDKQGVIWIGTENGLNAYDPKLGVTESYTAGQSPDSLLFGAVISLTHDSDDNLWVGTWSGGLHHFNKKTKKFKRYYSPIESQIVFPGKFIWDLFTDKDGTIWVGTERHGVATYDQESDSFKMITNSRGDPIDGRSPVWSIAQDKEGFIWVGTTEGLVKYDKASGRVKLIQTREKGESSGLKSQYVYDLAVHSSGDLLIGTEGGGLHRYNQKTQAISNLDMSDGLPSSNIASVFEDLDNDIWVATPSGVSRIDHNTQSISTFTKSDGLVGNLHNRDATLVDKQGNIYIGSVEGISIFNPRLLPKSIVSMQPVLTQFKLFNDEVNDFSSKSPLNTSITYAEKVVLTYKDLMFSVTYSALNYRSPEKVRYAYMLEGFDTQWRHVGSGRSATYTNLDAGKYQFRVRSSIDGRRWSKSDRFLTLVIQPAPWRSWWAYTMYGLALFWFLYLIYRYQTKKAELDNEKILSARLLRLDNVKDIFLANTSHELRTPINAMIGVAESLTLVEKKSHHKLISIQKDIHQLVSSLSNRKEDLSLLRDLEREYMWFREYREQNFQLLVKSGKRLSHLINDILDYSKLQNHDLKLHKNWVSLYGLAEEVLALLVPLAKDKLIELELQKRSENAMAWVDSNRIQQILINMVTNSIKYSERGLVRVVIEYFERRSCYVIQVIDQGIGIRPEKLAHVFTAFDQLNSESEFAAGGTGLGLSVTKKLVELHQGTIHVSSEVGVGSTFTIELPVQGERPPEYVEKVVPDTVKSYESDLKEPTRHEPILTVLIVDDDPINRTILRVTLESNNMKVEEARNAETALDLIRHTQFDVVISDHNMPGGTGLDLCTELRRTHSKDVLPFILITANNPGEAIEGSEAAGISDLLNKPIESSKLLATLERYVYRP